MSAYPHLVIEELLDIIKLVMWVMHIYVSVPHLVIEELLDIIKLVMWVIHIYVSVPSLGNWRAIRYYKVSYVSDTHICQRTLTW